MIRLHPDRYNLTSQVHKLGVVVHDAESGDGAASTLVRLLEGPGDRPSDPPPGRYGAGYHAVTDGTGGYVDMADGTAGPFSAPPVNATWWHVCMPGRAAQTRDEWLDELSRNHIRGVAAFIVDSWHADQCTWPLRFRSAAELAGGTGGYTSHAQVSLAWRKSTHTDPGVSFPWDVLEHDIAALLNDQTEDDMNARRVKNPRYQDIWLVGAGPALHLSPELNDTYADVELIVSDHPQLLKAMLFQSGLTESDLVKA